MVGAFPFHSDGSAAWWFDSQRELVFFPCFFLGGGGSYEQVPAMKISGATILGLAKSIYYKCLVKLSRGAGLSRVSETISIIT